MSVLLIGLVALLQITYLPGTLVLRWFRSEDLDRFERLALGFALSLIVNTWIVTCSVVAKLYSRPLLWIIIVVELAFLFAPALKNNSGSRYVTWDLRYLRDRRLPPSFRNTLGSIAASATIVIFCYMVYLNWGTVFSQNDDVASWNRWAIEWAHGTLPTRASWYPQLLPANWSVTYVLLGRTDVQMFAKATTVLFPLLTLLLFVSLALKRRTSAFLFAAGAYGWILLHYLGITFAMSGYADLPLAFFAFLAFYVIYRRDGQSPSRQDVLLLLLFALADLLTKQGGVYTLAIALLYAVSYARVRLKPALFGGGDASAVAVLWAFAFTAAWFGYKAVQIHGGQDYSAIAALTQLNSRQGPLQRILATGELFWNFRGPSGPPVTILFAALLTGGIFLKDTRRITLGLVIPFLLVYALSFSYEIRNASLAFPFVALISGLVVDRVLFVLSRPFDDLHLASISLGRLSAVLVALFFSGWVLMGEPMASIVLPSRLVTLLHDEWISYALYIYAVPCAIVGFLILLTLGSTARDLNIQLYRPAAIACALIAIIAASSKYPAGKIIQAQVAQERRIGVPAVNERLYAAVQEGSIQQPIITDYWFLQFLPGLERFFRRLPCGAPCSYQGLKAAATSVPDAGYVFMYDRDFDSDVLEKLEKNRGFRTLFTVEGLRLMRIDRGAFDGIDHAPEVSADSTGILDANTASFKIRYSDPDGISDIASVTVIVNDNLSGTGACYVEWYRATGTIAIANDNGKGWADERKVGSTLPMRNSQCEVDLASASIGERDGDLELALRARFLPSFRGFKHVYALATDTYQVNSGYRELAAWEVK